MVAGLSLSRPRQVVQHSLRMAQHGFERAERRYPLGTKVVTSFIGGSIADLSAQWIATGHVSYTRNFHFALLAAANSVGLHFLYKYAILKIDNRTLIGKIERPLFDFLFFSSVSTMWFFVGTAVLDKNMTLTQFWHSPLPFRAVQTWLTAFFFWFPFNLYMYNTESISPRYWIVATNTAAILWMSWLSLLSH